MRVMPSKHLAQTFRRKIGSGEWAVGARLPTTRALSSEFEVSVNTIQGAFRYLEAEGLVERSPRRGGFVKAMPSEAPEAVRAPAVKGIAIIAEAVSSNEPREGQNWCYRIARAAERELARIGFHVSLLSWEVDRDDALSRLQANVNEVSSQIAGAICFPTAQMPSMVAQFDELAIPYVTINRPNPCATNNFVVADNAGGGRTVGTCFARMGLDSVVVLGDHLTAGNSSMEKFAGFLEGYLMGGMRSRNVDFLRCDGFHFGDGYRAMQAHAKQFGRPRGIYTTGDYLALGALQFCREQGWAVPDDVGIASTTGLDVAAYSYPSLTVLEQPMDEMGTSAAQMLATMISQGTRRMPGIYIPGTFVVRQSLPVPPALAEELGCTMPPDERQKAGRELPPRDPEQSCRSVQRPQ